ncbi:MAG TPA: ATP-binding protein [Kofleriaceae bacterium]|nr:ATP-binding protein [Kofleriaceae bacterium]
MTRARWAALVTLGVTLGVMATFAPSAAAPPAVIPDELAAPPGLARFRGFGPAEGLRNLVILSVDQDARGFLWVGSDDGVYRFDGERFTHFGVTEGVVSSAVNVLRTAPDGNICAGSRAGLACWDGARFSQAPGLPTGAVLSLASARGRLWAGTEHGLYVREGNAPFALASGWVGDAPVRAVWADDDGVIASDLDRLWISPGDGAWRALTDIGLTGDRIDDLLRDRAGHIWIRAAHHLWQLARGAAHIRDLSDGFPSGFSVGPTGTMVNGAHGEVWFASDTGIVYRDGERWRLRGRAQGLPFPGARTLFIDREGSMWIGTVGLYQWRGRGLIERFETGNGLPGDVAWTFGRDAEGALWVGTNRCLAHAVDGRWECLPASDRRTIRSFVFPPQGGVFFGGFPSDLVYVDPAGHATVITPAEDDVADRAILALALDPRGDLWLATRGGLFRLAGARPGPLERVRVPGVPIDAWYASLVVVGNTLWAASNQGLVAYDGAAWRVYTASDGLGSSAVRYLLHSKTRGLCVSYTDAIGLSCFERDAARPGAPITRITHLGVEQGLGAGAVYFLGEDARGRLWVGTGDGVDVFTPGGVEHFGAADGLAGDDASATAFFEDRDGSLWLGSTGGASRFHAERYDGPAPPPRAMLRAGQLGQQVIRGSERTRLETPHDLNALRVELSSDRLGDADRIEYQARLVPLEPEWSATSARQARYPALLPGNYRLEVRARIGTGGWGPITALSFVVSPAWWQTRWFLALVGLAILCTIGLAFTWRQRTVLQRRTRQLNAESTANLRTLLELVPDLISVHRGAKVIYANLAARHTYGITEGELVGLGDRIHPDDRARVAEVLEPPHRDPDPTLPPVPRLTTGELGTLDALEDLEAGPASAIWSSQVVAVRVRDRDGSWRTCEVSGVQMVLAGATVIVVSGRDVTERHRLRAQLMVSDRMASLGTLAAGIAHEINNPLSYVLGNLQMMKESLVTGGELLRGPELATAIHDANDGAQRVRKIVQGLRSFSRAEEETRVQLAISDVIGAAIRLTANEVKHRAQLVCQLGATPKVVADDGRLTQVFINLIVNAAHAIPEGAWNDHRITVRTFTDDQGHAVIEIEDTGCGMSLEVQARAFDPFFTTKDVGSGTGLGLSICHGIIGALGGQIAIDSATGRGTRIRVVLPPAPVPEPAVARVATPSQSPVAHRLRVLVVDDEPLVSDMLARVLRKDHEVVAVACGRSALDQIEGGTWFDAIVSDVMMPNMNGIELLDALVQLDPVQANRLIFLSGGVFTPETRARLDALGTLQLEKPISPKELRSAVMSVARGELQQTAG